MGSLQHFCHPKHPLVFNQDNKRGYNCSGCNELILGPSYSCVKCNDKYHHKSCAKLPLGSHHPLHPMHPLILVDRQGSCEICKEDKWEYTYRCYHCNFNLHIRCAFLLPTLEGDVHDHPLIPIWKWITFTCDFCGKEDDKGMPHLCNTCGIWIHRRCASNFPRRVKVIRHKHRLHLTHSSLELHESDSQFCQLCIQKEDTRYGLYYCSKCDFVAHLNCAMAKENRKDINLRELKDGENEGQELNEIATEIKHFSHEHDLKLTYEDVHNNEKCHGCVRSIFPPFYNCAKCSFFLHKSCANLPMTKQHPLTLLPKAPTTSKTILCDVYGQVSNGFIYFCQPCWFRIDVQCSLISDILTHKGHKHQLFLSNTTQKQKCSCCDNERCQVFRCTTCEFALDFKCATLPHTTRFKQHEHPFALCYTAEDDSDEYYCDICKKEQDSKHWFYYCAHCNYSSHPECILGKYPNCKFGGVYTFDSHPHPLTFIEEAKEHPQCGRCSNPYQELIYQCAQCNFNMHRLCI